MVTEAALNVVNGCLRIARRERVLIVTDGRKAAFGRALLEAAQRAGREVTRHRLAALVGGEPPEETAKRMRECDVVIVLARWSLTHSKASAQARRAGARIASMPNVPSASWLRGGLLADYGRVRATVERAYSLFKPCARLEVLSFGGTALRFSLERGTRWIRESGLIHRPGDLDNLPAGMIAARPAPGTAEGRLVFDFLKGSPGRVALELRRGVIVRVEGDAAARRLFARFGARSRRLAEFGLGCNAWARPTRSTVESEKVLGACHFGFGNDLVFGGSNAVPFHRDGIVRKPTIRSDGRTLVGEGRFYGLASRSRPSSAGSLVGNLQTRSTQT